MRISDWSSDVCSSDLNRARAEEMAERLTDLQASIAVVDDLETAVHAADTVSCATLSREPLVRGEWLRPGMHVDLVGGFTPEMRSEEHTSELQSLMRISYAVFCLKKKKERHKHTYYAPTY